jgi:hypothetical protein
MEIRKRKRKDFYTYFKKTNPELKYTQGEFAKVVDMYADLIGEDLLDGKQVLLPKRFGKISLVRKEQNIDRLRIDWKATKEHGSLMYHLNEHTDGWYVRSRWDRSLKTKRYTTHFYFRLSAVKKRILIKRLKNIKDYYRRFYI